MEDAVRDENNVQGKVGCRDTEHDKCQHYHEDGGDRPLSPGAAAKAGEVLSSEGLERATYSKYTAVNVKIMYAPW